MVDLKEEVEAAAPAASGVDMPTHNGARVVAGAQALSPYLGERMMAADRLGKPAVLRELMPQDLNLEIEQFTRSEAVHAARHLANVVGRAHARQMSAPVRAGWRTELEHSRKGQTRRAPLALVQRDLAAQHEEAYLEHCRKYAMADVD